MAISTTFKDVQEKFNPAYWNSIDEFENYYLLRISEEMGEYNYYTDRNGNEIKIEPVDHYPNLKQYEVWSEGFSATGENSGAILFGKTHARNFAQACHKVMCQNKLKDIEEENNLQNNRYVNSARWDYNCTSLSYWGCKLFWSEELARKSFG